MLRGPQQQHPCIIFCRPLYTHTQRPADTFNSPKPHGRLSNAVSRQNITNILLNRIIGMAFGRQPLQRQTDYYFIVPQHSICTIPYCMYTLLSLVLIVPHTPFRQSAHEQLIRFQHTFEFCCFASAYRKVFADDHALVCPADQFVIINTYTNKVSHCLPGIR